MNKNIIKTLILSIIIFVGIGNVKGVSLSIEKKEAKVGEIVNIGVIIQENTGIVGMDFLLEYDQKKLEYISANSCEMLKGKICNISENDKGIRFLCVGNNIEGNGKIFEIEFKVKNGADSSNIPLNVKINDMINDAGNQNIVDVETKVENGNIIVGKEKNEQSESKDNVFITSGDGNFYIENNDGSISIGQRNQEENVKYYSNDENVLKVDEEGNIKIIDSGTVEITAQYNDEISKKIVLNVEKVTNDESEEDMITKENVMLDHKILVIVLFVVIMFIFTIIIIYVLKKRRKNGK